MKEKKARVEDALHATRAAVEEGIVPGGGVALIRAKEAIAKLKGDNVDQEAGIKLVLRAVEAPLRTIVANAGDEPSVVVNNVANGKGNYGYNAATGERSEEHTSELQSLMRISYAVFCLKKKNNNKIQPCLRYHDKT